MAQYIPSGIPIDILRIAAVPNNANVVMAFIQKPRKPMYARNAKEYTAALGPAERPVINTIALITTIQGVVTKSISRASRTDLIPKVIAVKRTSPLITA